MNTTDTGDPGPQGTIVAGRAQRPADRPRRHDRPRPPAHRRHRPGARVLRRRARVRRHCRGARRARLGDDRATCCSSSAGGYHHHLGFNTWKSAGGGPQPDGVAGLHHVAIRYPTRAGAGRRAAAAARGRLADPAGDRPRHARGDLPERSRRQRPRADVGPPAGAVAARRRGARSGSSTASSTSTLLLTEAARPSRSSSSAHGDDGSAVAAVEADPPAVGVAARREEVGPVLRHHPRGHEHDGRVERLRARCGRSARPIGDGERRDEARPALVDAQAGDVDARSQRMGADVHDGAEGAGHALVIGRFGAMSQPDVATAAVASQARATLAACTAWSSGARRPARARRSARPAPAGSPPRHTPAPPRCSRGPRRRSAAPPRSCAAAVADHDELRPLALDDADQRLQRRPVVRHRVVARTGSRAPRGSRRPRAGARRGAT